MHYIFQHSRHRKYNESQRQEAILMNRTKKKEKAEIKHTKLCKKFQIRNILQKNGQKFLGLHL